MVRDESFAKKCLFGQGPYSETGTGVMILKIFSLKKLAFLQKNITLVFEKNANFFAENWQKSLKIVIITSTPGRSFAPAQIQCDPKCLRS
jgi:hypothetical protein